MEEAPVFQIRPATPGDGASIATLVRELAVYERLEDFAQATPDDFEHALFGPRPFAEGLIAEVAGQPVGLALFFYTFSTFRGRPSVYLEDLFVRPEHRGLGIGKALLEQVARTGFSRGCQRMEWAVLDWNEPAIGFYKSLGARPMDEWTVYRLDGEAFERLGRR